MNIPDTASATVASSSSTLNIIYTIYTLTHTQTLSHKTYTNSKLLIPNKSVVRTVSRKRKSAFSFWHYIWVCTRFVFFFSSHCSSISLKCERMRVVQFSSWWEYCVSYLVTTTTTTTINNKKKRERKKQNKIGFWINGRYYRWIHCNKHMYTK